MGEVPPLTEEEIQVMEPVFEYMQQVRGKPALESTAQVYDLLTGTEKRASYSHEMMLTVMLIRIKIMWRVPQMNRHIVPLFTRT